MYLKVCVSAVSSVRWHLTKLKSICSGKSYKYLHPNPYFIILADDGCNHSWFMAYLIHGHICHI